MSLRGTKQSQFKRNRVVKTLDDKELDLYLTKYGDWVRPLVDEIRRLRKENIQLKLLLASNSIKN